MMRAGACSVCESFRAGRWFIVGRCGDVVRFEDDVFLQSAVEAGRTKIVLVRLGFFSACRQVLVLPLRETARIRLRELFQFAGVGGAVFVHHLNPVAFLLNVEGVQEIGALF